MELKELIENLHVKSVSGPMATDIAGIAYDSRRVSPGDLFVALRGQRADGIEFACQAVEAGAAAVMSEQPAPPDAGVPWVQVDNGRKAMALVSSALFGNPSDDLVVAGVTGTNGKTTTAFLLHHLLKSAWRRCGLIGTIGVETGEAWLPATLTTPESVETQGLMARMRGEGCRGVVMEVSSHGLAQYRLDGIRFSLGVFTNLSQDHLDFHGDMEAYFSAKKRLFDLMEAQQSASAGRRGGERPVMVVNSDDRFGKRLVEEEFTGLKLVTYGLGMGCDFRASRIHSDFNGTVFQLEMARRSMLVRTPLIGVFNVYNALAALAAVQALNLNLREAVANLADAPQIPGRLESVGGRQINFRVYVDYAHTPDALEQALKTLRGLDPERIITVFGCGGDRDQKKRPLMGRVVDQLSDGAFVTSDNPRSEEPGKIIREIVAGMRKGAYQVMEDRRGAIRAAIDLAGSRDIVLIAGKGHEDYQEIEGIRHPFDDRRVARQYIAATVEDRDARKREQMEKDEGRAWE